MGAFVLVFGALVLIWDAFGLRVEALGVILGGLVLIWEALGLIFEASGGVLGAWARHLGSLRALG